MTISRKSKSRSKPQSKTNFAECETTLVEIELDSAWNFEPKAQMGQSPAEEKTNIRF